MVSVHVFLGVDKTEVRLKLSNNFRNASAQPEKMRSPRKIILWHVTMLVIISIDILGAKFEFDSVFSRILSERNPNH